MKAILLAILLLAACTEQVTQEEKLPLELSIISPKQGEEFMNIVPFEVRIKAFSDGEVIMQLDNEEPREMKARAYNLLNLEEGQHTITVTATRKDGHAITESVTFSIVKPRPELEIIQPKTREYTEKVPVQLEISTLGIPVKVESTLDGNIPVYLDSNYSTTLNNVPPGTHYYTAKVKHMNGTTLTQKTVSFTIPTPPPAPKIQYGILLPQPGQRIKNEDISVIIETELEIGEEQHFLFTLDGHTFPVYKKVQVIKNLPNGKHSLKVELVKQGKKYGQASVNFTTESI